MYKDQHTRKTQMISKNQKAEIERYTRSVREIELKYDIKFKDDILKDFISYIQMPLKERKKFRLSKEYEEFSMVNLLNIVKVAELTKSIYEKEMKEKEIEKIYAESMGEDA